MSPTRIDELMRKLRDDPERERVMGMLSKLSGELCSSGDGAGAYTINKLWHLAFEAGETRTSNA